MVQRCQRDGPGIVGIGFASAASGQDSDFHCEGGRNVNDVLAPRDQNLRYATAEALCSLDRVCPFGSSLALFHQRGGGAGIDHEPTGPDGGAAAVDGNCGE